MNLYDCRFIDSDDEVFHVNQYGNSSWEIENFWNEWNMIVHKNNSDRRFVSCKLLEENVPYDKSKENEYIRKILDRDDRFDFRYDDHGIFVTERHVFFFKNKCPFSNFYIPCRFIFEYNGEIHTFYSSEQAFMWVKAMTFEDTEIAEKIMNEGKHNPRLCKDLGRKVKNYDDEKWSAIRYGVFLKINLAKFSQNDNIKTFLMDHRFDNKTFAEASPWDSIWGIGMRLEDEGVDDEKNWRGQNLMGKCITEVRNIILRP